MAQPPRLRAVEDPDEPAPPPSPGGGNGGRYDRLDDRLRVVEGDVREIKTRLETVATKNDIDRLESKLKIWLSGSTVTALAMVIGWLVFWIVRLVSSAPATPPGFPPQ